LSELVLQLGNLAVCQRVLNRNRNRFETWPRNATSSSPNAFARAVPTLKTPSTLPRLITGKRHTDFARSAATTCSCRIFLRQVQRLSSLEDRGDRRGNFAGRYFFMEARQLLSGKRFPAYGLEIPSVFSGSLTDCAVTTISVFTVIP
jgi:hypothetical protein